MQKFENQNARENAAKQQEVKIFITGNWKEKE